MDIRIPTRPIWQSKWGFGLGIQHAGWNFVPKTQGAKTFMMDLTWVTDRIAVGGGIWNPQNMAELVRDGVTHILDMQIEFDDTQLAEGHPVTVFWNPTDDDFQHKSVDLFRGGVEFALDALDEPNSKLYVHCAAGIHRAPMMTLAILCSLGWKLDEAMAMIAEKRPVVDFASVYVSSVKAFLEEQVEENVRS